MSMEIKKLKDKVYKNYEIMRQVGVLKSHGIDVKLYINIVNDKILISLKSVHITKEYLERHQIINTPQIEIYHYRVESVDIFQLDKPKKHALKESAIRSGFAVDNSAFETVIENIYEQSLADIIIKQQKMTKEFKKVANENLPYLKEVIDKFCEYENKPKLSLSW